jgi:SpoVK/Ycf46/Vps4 family AAA+-type ATPase
LIFNLQFPWLLFITTNTKQSRLQNDQRTQQRNRFLLAKRPTEFRSNVPAQRSLVSSGLHERLELTLTACPGFKSTRAFVALDPPPRSGATRWFPVHLTVSSDSSADTLDADNIPVAVPSASLLSALNSGSPVAEEQCVLVRERCVLVHERHQVSIPTARLVRFVSLTSSATSNAGCESAADGPLIRACLAGQVVWGGAVVSVGSLLFKIVDALAVVDDADDCGEQVIVTAGFSIPALSSTSGDTNPDDVVSFVRYDEPDEPCHAVSSAATDTTPWPPLEAQVWAEHASQLLGGVGLSTCRRLTDWMAGEGSGGMAQLGAIVSGLPGSGKRTVVDAVARSAGLPVLELDPRNAFNGQIGAGEEHISDVLLNRAVASSPCVVVIRSVELLAPPALGRGNAEQRLCAVLMSALDSLAAGPARVLVVGTTSHPDGVDVALRSGSRLSLDVMLPSPTLEDRTKIMTSLFSSITLSTTLDGCGTTSSNEKEEIATEIARRANGFVRADLEGLVREAFMWQRRHQPGREASPYLSFEALLKGLDAVQPHAMRAMGQQKEHDDSTTTSTPLIAGLRVARAQMLEAVVMPLRHSVALAQRGVGGPKGVLLYGPSGNGKTALSRELQRILKHEGLANFVSVPCSSLISKQVGGSEAAVVNAFARARRAAPCVLFLDQIEAIAPRRGFDSSSQQTFDRILSCLLTEMDGILNKEDRGEEDDAPHQPVILVAATDKVDALDAAILRPGRFDQIISVDEPDESERAELINHFLRRTRIVGAGETVMAQIVARTEGWSAAELEGVCREAVLDCLRRDIHCEALDLGLLLERVALSA